MSFVQIIDSKDQNPIDDSFKIYWNSFSSLGVDNALSIPSYIEKYSVEIREEYLRFVFSLSHSTIKKKKILSHLAIDSGFSFWWTTLIAQKCNYSKSPELNNIIKFIGFKHWIQTNEVTSIKLYTGNANLASTFKLLCEAKGIKYIHINQDIEESKSNRSFLKKIYDKFPMSLQAIIWAIMYLIEHWKFKGVNLSEWKRSNSRITIMSYLLHLDPEKFKCGEHQSGFWGPLPKLLNKNGENINWIHIYEKNSLIPTTNGAVQSIKNFSKKNGDVHVVLETFLSFSVLLKAGFDWIKLMNTGYILSEKFERSHDSSLENSEILPMIKTDFYKSIFGQEGLRNILTFHLVNSALSFLPKQNLGILPCEFQPQELSFTYLFKKLGHNNLVANCHSTIRFWDLRYHFDKNTFTDNSQYLMPLPNYLAVNGQNMHNSLSQSNFIDKKIIHVEALRYLYLEDAKNFSSIKKVQKSKNSIKLLVMGDYLMENNVFLLESLRDAITSSKTKFEITFKYHPACVVNEDSYPDIAFRQTGENMENLLSKSDIVLASNVTSASVDAICYGVPVVSLLDPKKLNMNPLRGQTRAFFASSPDDLCFILENYEKMLSNNPHEVKSDFFNLDSSLYLWRKLIKSCLN